jgi:hypothetical protein
MLTIKFRDFNQEFEKAETLGEINQSDFANANTLIRDMLNNHLGDCKDTIIRNMFIDNKFVIGGWCHNQNISIKFKYCEHSFRNCLHNTESTLKRFLITQPEYLINVPNSKSSDPILKMKAYEAVKTLGDKLIFDYPYFFNTIFISSIYSCTTLMSNYNITLSNSWGYIKSPVAFTIIVPLNGRRSFKPFKSKEHGKPYITLPNIPIQSLIDKNISLMYNEQFEQLRDSNATMLINVNLSAFKELMFECADIEDVSGISIQLQPLWCEDNNLKIEFNSNCLDETECPVDDTFSSTYMLKENLEATDRLTRQGKKITKNFDELFAIFKTLKFPEEIVKEDWPEKLYPFALAFFNEYYYYKIEIKIMSKLEKELKQQKILFKTISQLPIKCSSDNVFINNVPLNHGNGNNSSVKATVNKIEDMTNDYDEPGECETLVQQPLHKKFKN